MVKEEKNLEVATFAGGCFWCLEKAFDDILGVEENISGYTGGEIENPTYDEVCSGNTGHYESVQVFFDSDVVSYEELLYVFFTNIDPTDPKGQFSDRGHQYETAIFFHNNVQKEIALQVKKTIEDSKIFLKPIATKILPASKFFKAEEYHQDFYKNFPIRYCTYEMFSGRKRFIEEFWKSKSIFKLPKKKYNPRFAKKDLSKLSDLEYKVTQKCGTEPPFQNKYWNNKKPEIYVDIVSGEPLFSSIHKYDSNTGWPSFFQALEPNNITYHLDKSLGITRIEVRSKHADSHLGHVFDDGPEPTRLRYCINSSALRFIPVENLEKEGYAEYLKLFE